MYYKTVHVFDVIEFESNDFDNNLKKIEKSNIYLGYIKHKEVLNQAYQKYLEHKKQVYISQIIDEEKENFLALQHRPTPFELSNQKLSLLKKQYAKKDDYWLYQDVLMFEKEKGIYELSDDSIILQEEDQRNLSLQIVDNYLEIINEDYLDSQFTYSQYQRYSLIPVRTTINGESLDSQTILTVYKEGLATIHLIFNFPITNFLTLPDDKPNSFTFDEIIFLHLKERYNAEDYWNTYTRNRTNSIDNQLSSFGILEYYKNLIKKVIETTTPKSTNQTAQMFHFISEVNKDESIEEINEKDLSVESNRSVITGILRNAPFFFNSRSTDEKNEDYLNNTIIRNDKDLSVWVSKSAAVLLYKSTSTVNEMYEEIRSKYTEGSQKDNITEDLEKQIDNEFKLSYYQALLGISLQFAKLYELALIHRFNTKKILNLLRDRNYKSPKELEELRSKMNHFLLNYNAELVFNNEGTPKEDYKNILEKFGVNELVELAQRSIDNIHVDFNNLITRQEAFQEQQKKIQNQRDQEQEKFREKQEQKSENNIFFLTTTIGVIVGYEPLQSLVETFFDIVNISILNLVFFFTPLLGLIFEYLSFVHSVEPTFSLLNTNASNYTNHISIGIWLIFVISIILLNILRYRSINKKVKESSPVHKKIDDIKDHSLKK